MNFFNFFEARLACLRIQKFFRNWYCLWKNLECFILWSTCRKNSNFLINRCSMWNELKYFKFPKLKKLAEKTQSFLEPIHSRKWIEIVYKFLARIACLKISKCLWADWVYKKNWMFSIFWSLSSLQEKKSGKQFCLWSNLEKWKIFTAGNAWLKTSIFSQTDSVDEMNWKTSKLHSSISLLKKLKFHNPIQTIKRIDQLQNSKD